MTQAERKKDFLENRTSWKFFNRLMTTDKDKNISSVYGAAVMVARIGLEILKELQYMNDKTKRLTRKP